MEWSFAFCTRAHKTSRYTEEECLGLEDALVDIPQYGLVTLSRNRTFCLRPGNKPVLRGTIVHFGEKKGLVCVGGIGGRLFVKTDV